MNTKLERKEYPNRKTLRSMYERRINRKLTYDQFRTAVKRDIDLNNAKFDAEFTMNQQMSKVGTEGPEPMQDSMQKAMITTLKEMIK